MNSPTRHYDHFPYIRVSESNADCSLGWESIGNVLRLSQGVIALELYPGCNATEIESHVVSALLPDRVIHSEQALLTPAQLDQKFGQLLGSDPVFAVMCSCELKDFFCPVRLAQLESELAEIKGRVLVIGTGASLVAPRSDCLIYADLARWEIQKRQRAHQVGNLGAENAHASAAALYKRAFFLDWRAADRLKAHLLPRIDYLLDTNTAEEPKMITGEQFRHALRTASRQPFRVVPFFDPGPWGGQWMKENFQLPDGPPNYAWCFDCVPEENSLLLAFGDRRIEIPALDLVLFCPQELLGEHIYGAFGPEFPIRFDYLDTMEGGNLSLQVHPLQSYIHEKFGMDYTQDESYYILEAGDDGIVYLGLKEGIDAKQMEHGLRCAQVDAESPFPAENYVNAWPAKKHDHFLIPAGTIHCSGRNVVVLEISATPYIFTFKLWDWRRLGLDGHPRPIHLDHGLANIQWDRTTPWVRQHLVNQISEIASGPGWREERTGLHALEFIETRRHWFTRSVPHNTYDTVNVLNLVEGDAAIVESPTGSFAPFPVNFGETFIVPAQIGPYIVSPLRPADKPLATVKAFVRESTG